MKMKKQNGFTMIELLVVLVIIGILSAVTIPAVVGYIKKAKDSKDDTNASSLTNVLSLAASGTHNTISIKNFDINDCLQAIIDSGSTVTPVDPNRVFIMDYTNLEVRAIDTTKWKKGTKINTDEKHPASIEISHDIESTEFVKGQSIIRLESYTKDSTTFMGYNITAKKLSDNDKKYNSDTAGLYKFQDGTCQEYFDWSSVVSTGYIAVSGNRLDNKVTNDAKSTYFTGNLVLPSSIRYLGEDCFKDCKNLYRVFIPEISKEKNGGVKFSGGTFAGCTKLTDIYYQGTYTQMNAMLSEAALRDAETKWNEGCTSLTRIDCSDEYLILG